jgi:hypothetical protein
MDGKGKLAGPVVALALLISVIGSAYVGGYFWLSKQSEVGSCLGRPLVLRFYRYQWLAEAYRPLARIESSVTDRDVVTAGGWPWMTF